MKDVIQPCARRLVITDLDGTLLPTIGQFNPTDLATLETLGQCQVIRVIATGRSLYAAYKVLPLAFPLDYLIFSSGAGILDWRSRQIVVAHHLSQAEILRAAQVLLSYQLDFMLHRPIPDNHYFWYYATGQENPDFVRRYQRYQEFATPLALVAERSVPTQACQFVAIDPNHGAESKYAQIQSDLPTLKVIRSTSPLDGRSTWIEIFPATVSKALAGDWIARQHQLTSTDTLALGNDYNDLDLLQWAGTRFVVQNAPADLQEQYPSVSSNNAGGFTEAVHQWMNSENDKNCG